MRKSAWLLLIPLALVTGIFAGDMYQRFNESNEWEKQIPVTEQKAQERLERFISGIEVGKKFPNIPVWRPDGTQAMNLLDLNTSGVVLALISISCESCVEDVTKLKNAWHGFGDTALPLILLADDAENAEEVHEQLRTTGINLPLWCDATRTLRQEYHVITRNAYFRLDADGVLVAMRAWVFDPADLRSLFL